MKAHEFTETLQAAIEDLAALHPHEIDELPGYVAELAELLQQVRVRSYSDGGWLTSDAGFTIDSGSGSADVLHVTLTGRFTTKEEAMADEDEDEGREEPSEASSPCGIEQLDDAEVEEDFCARCSLPDSECRCYAPDTDEVQHRFSTIDDRCTCGAEEAFIDGVGYGCVTQIVGWDDPLRRWLGPATYGRVREYADVWQCSIASATHSLHDEAVERLAKRG